MSSADPTLSSVVSGNPAASYATPGIGLFPENLPLPVKLIAPSGGVKFFGASTVTSPLVAPSVSLVSTPFCFAPYASVSSTPGVSTAPGTASGAQTCCSTTLPFSSASAGPSSSPRTFVFASPSVSSSRAFIARGVWFRVPFRGVTNDELLAAIAVTVPVAQITDISRVVGVVHVYFRDPSWARQLIASGLGLRSACLAVLPLGITPRRVIVSDVPPEFPDSFVRSILASYGVVRGSIVTLPAATTNVAYKHVRSFRRAGDVVFASDADFLALPSSVAVRFDDRALTFGLNAPVKCFVCSGLGHTAQTCPSRRLASPSGAVTSRVSGSRRKRSRRARVAPPSPSSIVSPTPLAPSTPTVVVSLPAPSTLVPLPPVSSPLGLCSGSLSPPSSPLRRSPASSLASVLSPGVVGGAACVAPSAIAPSLPLELAPAAAFAPPEALPSPMEPSAAASVPLQDSSSDACAGFTAVASRRRRSRALSSPTPLAVASSPVVSAGTPSAWGRGPQYVFEPRFNQWTDVLGAFAPVLDYDSVRSVAVRVVGLSAASASAILVPLAPTPEKLALLIRQIMVFAYTDPLISALPYGPRSAERQRYNDLRRSMCAAHRLFANAR